MSKGLLMIISGPSGSGKGTVTKRLCRDTRYALSISVTTRQPRVGESEGVDYFFRTTEEFFRLLNEGELLESAFFVGNYYGTPAFYVKEQIAAGKVVILEIDVKGALQVRNKWPESILLFLIPPTLGDLRKRLTLRATEDLETIEERLFRAREEISEIEQYDYLVINESVERAEADINAIVTAELLKPQHKVGFIEQFKGGI